jgi:leader peptidase (prepilin peptidase)/N-methyltransferase
VLVVAPVVLALVLGLGVWLAHVGVRVAARYSGADGDLRPSPARMAVVALVLLALLVGAAAVTGARPALVALGWAAAAAVVLAQVDLAVHRLPDRIVYPAVGVVAAAYLVDALALGTWDALLRALLAGAATFAGGAVAAAVPAEGLGFGDVKLLGLLGLVLGWFGWPAVAAGVLFGLVVGALVALALLVTRRADRRSAIPFGPALIAGGVLALALGVAGPAG